MSHKLLGISENVRPQLSSGINQNWFVKELHMDREPRLNKILLRWSSFGNTHFWWNLIDHWVKQVNLVKQNGGLKCLLMTEIWIQDPFSKVKTLSIANVEWLALQCWSFKVGLGWLLIRCPPLGFDLCGLRCRSDCEPPCRLAIVYNGKQRHVMTSLPSLLAYDAGSHDTPLWQSCAF